MKVFSNIQIKYTVNFHPVPWLAQASTICHANAEFFWGRYFQTQFSDLSGNIEVSDLLAPGYKETVMDI